jgi:hypothetical protein
MANLESVGIRFSETMPGWLGAGEKDPRQGEVAGRSTAAAIRFDAGIHIQSLGRFLRDPDHAAQLTGTVSYAALGEKRPIRDGKFNLFAVEREAGMQTQYENYIARLEAGESLEPPWHTTKAVMQMDGKDRLVSGILSRVGARQAGLGDDFEILVAYPNYALIQEVDGQRRAVGCFITGTCWRTSTRHSRWRSPM